MGARRKPGAVGRAWRLVLRGRGRGPALRLAGLHGGHTRAFGVTSYQLGTISGQADTCHALKAGSKVSHSIAFPKSIERCYYAESVPMDVPLS